MRDEGMSIRWAFLEGAGDGIKASVGGVIGAGRWKGMAAGFCAGKVAYTFGIFVLIYSWKNWLASGSFLFLCKHRQKRWVSKQ